MEQAAILTPEDLLIVSRSSMDSDDPYDVIRSNIDFINGLFEEHLETNEVSLNALKSYYVDYYLTEVEEGGFSQFVYNSRWRDETISLIREGLEEIGAPQHSALFRRGEELVTSLGSDRLGMFLESDYFDDNIERDELSAIDHQIEAVLEVEDLIALNARWLKSCPNLVIVSDAEFKREINRRAEALPNREQRVAKARAEEPRYLKLIRALCEKSGHELDRITAGDSTHVYKDRRVLAWHFITNRGHHYMIDSEGTAIMFDGTSREVVSQIAAPE